MKTKPKDLGTANETTIVRWLHGVGFPHAVRTALSGSTDLGDIRVCDEPRIVIEAKRSLRTDVASGLPSDGLLRLWWSQTAAEHNASGALWSALVVKRWGTADAGAYLAYTSLRQLRDLMASSAPSEAESELALLAMLSLRDLARLWGQVVQPVGQPVVQVRP